MEAEGPFQIEDMSITVLVETLNDSGETDDNRRFSFRQSAQYGRDHSYWSIVTMTSKFHI